MDRSFDIPDADVLIASAARFLIEGGEEDAASLLLACNIANIPVTWTDHNSPAYGVDIHVLAPRVAYDVLIDEENPIFEQVKTAMGASLDHDCSLGQIRVRSERMSISPEWRTELVEMARGLLVHNQAATAEKFRLWQNLRFRSQSEIRIAEALERIGVMFFPNCMARLNGQNRRINLEPDFLVCRGGKWGILEVDGGEFHPPERTALEHERDRLFRNQGLIVERFNANRCYNEADTVVSEFFRILERS